MRAGFRMRRAEDAKGAAGSQGASSRFAFAAGALAAGAEAMHGLASPCTSAARRRRERPLRRTLAATLAGLGFGLCVASVAKMAGGHTVRGSFALPSTEEGRVGSNFRAAAKKADTSAGVRKQCGNSRRRASSFTACSGAHKSNTRESRRVQVSAR